MSNGIGNPWGSAIQGFNEGLESGMRMGLIQKDAREKQKERQMQLSLQLLENPNYPEAEKVKIYNETFIPLANKTGMNLQPVSEWSSPRTKMSRKISAAYTSGLRGKELAQLIDEEELKSGNLDPMRVRAKLEETKQREAEYGRKVLDVGRILERDLASPNPIETLFQNEDFQAILGSEDGPQIAAEAIKQYTEQRKAQAELTFKTNAEYRAQKGEERAGLVEQRAAKSFTLETGAKEKAKEDTFVKDFFASIKDSLGGQGFTLDPVTGTFTSGSKALTPELSASLWYRFRTSIPPGYDTEYMANRIAARLGPDPNFPRRTAPQAPPQAVRDLDIGTILENPATGEQFQLLQNGQWELLPSMITPGGERTKIDRQSLIPRSFRRENPLPSGITG